MNSSEPSGLTNCELGRGRGCPSRGAGGPMTTCGLAGGLRISAAAASTACRSSGTRRSGRCCPTRPSAIWARVGLLLRLQQRVAAHDEAARADAALEAALHPEGALDGMQALERRPVVNTGDGHDLLAAAQARAEDRAAVDGSPIDQHRAGAALRAVAAEVGDVQPELLSRGCPQRLAHVDDDVMLDAVDVQGDPPHVLRQRARRAGAAAGWPVPRAAAGPRRRALARAPAHDCSTGPRLHDGLWCGSCLTPCRVATATPPATIAVAATPSPAPAMKSRRVTTGRACSSAGSAPTGWVGSPAEPSCSGIRPPPFRSTLLH